MQVDLFSVSCGCSNTSITQLPKTESGPVLFLIRILIIFFISVVEVRLIIGISDFYYTWCEMELKQQKQTYN